MADCKRTIPCNKCTHNACVEIFINLKNTMSLFKASTVHITCYIHGLDISRHLNNYGPIQKNDVPKKIIMGPMMCIKICMVLP